MSDQDEFEAIFRTLDLDQATLELGHSATITPTVSRATQPLDPKRTLPQFRIEDSLGLDADYRIVDRIGEGGMGIVSLAEQVALQRMVAVKEPKGEHDRARTRVLEEAFIMGRMEHPNVVPAYGLGLRANGSPMLVMKRVEGTSWDDVLSGRKSAPDGVEPDLTFNLRVLLQVCNALRFAHARNVVHRDIKPENVMIGDFGEVYLLDWGIALSLGADEAAGIPTTTNSTGLAGTPAYMAPEMTNDDPSDVDERTDIYLLGATLHQLLTGEPPHAGKSLFEVCFSAYRSDPFSYEDSVGPELAGIAHRAMAREKADRFQTVGEFAAALDGYLEHRASYLLSNQAESLLSAIIDGGATATTNRLLEAEFGFRQALTIWAHNEAAQRGLQAAIEHRVRSCVEREEIVGAREALAQLPSANPALEEAIEALEVDLAARAERVDYLERFESELDLKTGTRARQRAVILFGGSFALICFWQAWEMRPGQPHPSMEENLWAFWRLIMVAAVGTGLFWRRLLSNVANRRLMAFFLSALVFMFLARVAAFYTNPPSLFLQAAEVCIIGMAAFAIGAASSRRLAAVALLFGAVVPIGAISGEISVMLVALGIVHIIFSSFTAWLWRPSLTRDRE